MKLHKKIFPEINLLSVLIAISWIAWTGHFLFAAGYIFLGTAVIAGMTCSYLNIYHDCRHYYLIKEMEEDISRLEKEYEDWTDKRRQANYEKLERNINYPTNTATEDTNE